MALLKNDDVLEPENNEEEIKLVCNTIVTQHIAPIMDDAMMYKKSNLLK